MAQAKIVVHIGVPELDLQEYQRVVTEDHQIGTGVANQDTPTIRAPVSSLTTTLRQPLAALGILLGVC